MPARYVIYFLFPKKRNRLNRLYAKLGSNFCEIYLLGECRLLSHTPSFILHTHKRLGNSSQLFLVPGSLLALLFHLSEEVVQQILYLLKAAPTGQAKQVSQVEVCFLQKVPSTIKNYNLRNNFSYQHWPVYIADYYSI